jgi:hypothetical protein
MNKTGGREVNVHNWGKCSKFFFVYLVAAQNPLRPSSCPILVGETLKYLYDYGYMEGLIVIVAVLTDGGGGGGGIWRQCPNDSISDIK